MQQMERNEYPQPEVYCNCINTTVRDKVAPHKKKGSKVSYNQSDLLLFIRKEKEPTFSAQESF
jgi:hypothetical protein